MERATGCMRAAAAILRDPRAPAHEAIGPLSRGWSELARALEPEVDPADPEDVARCVGRGLDRVRETTRGRMRERARRLVAAGHTTAPEGVEDPTVLRADLGLLRRALSEVRHGRMPWPRRVVARGAPLAAAVAAGIMVASVCVGLASRGWHGWRGAYYPQLGFRGDPVHRRDVRIQFWWDYGAALPALPRDAFTVRWDTCLEMPERRKLEVALGSDDGSRLFIDGERILDNWRTQPFHRETGHLQLDPGLHHVRVEYFEAGGEASITLELREPRMLPGAIPLDRFHLPADAAGSDTPCR